LTALLPSAAKIQTANFGASKDVAKNAMFTICLTICHEY